MSIINKVYLNTNSTILSTIFIIILIVILYIYYIYVYFKLGLVNNIENNKCNIKNMIIVSLFSNVNNKETNENNHIQFFDCLIKFIGLENNPYYIKLLETINTTEKIIYESNKQIIFMDDIVKKKLEKYYTNLDDIKNSVNQLQGGTNSKLNRLTTLASELNIIIDKEIGILFNSMKYIATKLYTNSYSSILTQKDTTNSNMIDRKFYSFNSQLTDIYSSLINKRTNNSYQGKDLNEYINKYKKLREDIETFNREHTIEFSNLKKNCSKINVVKNSFPNINIQGCDNIMVNYH